MPAADSRGQAILAVRVRPLLPVADLLSRDFVRLVAPEEHAHLIDCAGLQLGRLGPGVDRRCGIRRQRRDVDGHLVRMRRAIVRQNQHRRQARAREVTRNAVYEVGVAPIQTMQVSLNRRHGQVGPLGKQFRSPDIPAGVVHDIRVLWPVPDRLADDASYNAVWRALHELKSEAAADAVTHKKELADAEMIHQPQLVISKRTPRIIDIDGTSRIAAIGVALVHGYAAEVVLESFHDVYYCSRPIADSRVQAAARRNQKRKAATNFLITDANITSLVKWHRLRLPSFRQPRPPPGRTGPGTAARTRRQPPGVRSAFRARRFARLP